MTNPYIDLFNQLKENINKSSLSEANRAIVKCALIETFADVLAAQDKVNKDARLMLMDLLNNTVAPIDLGLKDKEAN